MNITLIYYENDFWKKPLETVLKKETHSKMEWEKLL